METPAADPAALLTLAWTGPAAAMAVLLILVQTLRWIALGAAGLAALLALGQALDRPPADEREAAVARQRASRLRRIPPVALTAALAAELLLFGVRWGLMRAGAGGAGLVWIALPWPEGTPPLALALAALTALTWGAALAGRRIGKLLPLFVHGLVLAGIAFAFSAEPLSTPGAGLPGPELWGRFFHRLLAGLVAGGLALAVGEAFGAPPSDSPAGAARRDLAKLGALLATLGIFLQVATGLWLMLVEPPVAQSTLLRPGGFGLIWMASIGAVMFLFMLAAATLALPRRRLAAGGAGLMLALVLAGMLAGRLGTRAALLAAGGGPGRLDAPLAAPAHYPWITFAALGLALGLTRLAQRMVFTAPGRG